MKAKQLRLGKGFRVAVGNRRVQVAEMVLSPGQSEGGPDNRHHGSDQALFVVSGRGEARINGHKRLLRAGTLILIERGDFHEIRNTGSTPLRTINAYVPPAYAKNGTTLPAGRS